MQRKWHLETWPSPRPMSLRSMMKCTEKLIINGEVVFILESTDLKPHLGCWRIVESFFLIVFFLFWGVQRNRFMVFLKMVKVRKWRRCLLIFSLKRGIGGHHFFRYDTSRKSNRSWLHKSQPCLQRPWCFQIQLSPSPRGPKCCPLWIHPLDGSERKTVGPRDLLGVPCWKVWGVSVKTTMFELTGRFIQTEGNQVKQISSRFGFGSWRGLGLSNVSICIACCTAARWVPRESWMVS